MLVRNRKLAQLHSLNRNRSCACGTACEEDYELASHNLNRKLVLRNRKLALHIRKLVLRNRKLVQHIRKLELRNHKLVRSPCHSNCSSCRIASTTSHGLASCSTNRNLNRKLGLHSHKLALHNRKLGLRSHKLVLHIRKHHS